MGGSPVGLVYCEVALDYTPYTRAQSNLLKSVKSTTLNVEKSYTDLGIKSSKTFDLMRAKIHNAYNRISNDATASAKDIIRAEQAKNQKLKQLNDQQFGAHTSLISKLKSNWMAYSVAIYAVQRGLRTALTAILSTGSEYEYTMSRVRAITKATGQDFEDLDHLAKSLGESTEYTASQVGELEVAYSKLGLSKNEIMEVTGLTLDLATAMGVGLSEAATTAAGTMNSFNAEAKELPRYMDVMAAGITSTALDMEKFQGAMANVGAAANAYGWSIEETTAKVGALVDANIEASKAGTDLRMVISVLSKTGMTYDEALDKIQNSTNKVKTAQELFGQRAFVSAIILADQREKVNDLTNEYDNATGSLKKMADTMRDNVQTQWLEFKSAVESVEIAIFEQEVGVLNETIEAMTGYVRDNKDALVKMADDGIGGVVTAIKTLKTLYDAMPDGVIGAGGVGLVGMMLWGPRAAAVGLFAGAILKTIELKNELKAIYDNVKDYTEGNYFRRGAGVTGSWEEEPQPPPYIDSWQVAAEKASEAATKKAVEAAKKLAEAREESVKESVKAVEAAAKEEAEIREALWKYEVKAATKLDDELADAYWDTQDAITKAAKDGSEDRVKITAEQFEAEINLKKMLFEGMTRKDADYFKYKKDALDAEKQVYLDLYGTDSGKISLINKAFAQRYKDQQIELLGESGKFFDGVGAYAEESIKHLTTWGNVGYEVTKAFASQGASAMSDGFFAIMKGETVDWGNLWKSVLDSMLRAFTDMLAQMIMQWAMSGLANLFGISSTSILGQVMGLSSGASGASSLGTMGQVGSKVAGMLGLGGGVAATTGIATTGSLTTSGGAAYSAVSGAGGTAVTSGLATGTGLLALGLAPSIFGPSITSGLRDLFGGGYEGVTYADKLAAYDAGLTYVPGWPDAGNPQEIPKAELDAMREAYAASTWRQTGGITSNMGDTPADIPSLDTSKLSGLSLPAIQQEVAKQELEYLYSLPEWDPNHPDYQNSDWMHQKGGILKKDKMLFLPGMPGGEGAFLGTPGEGVVSNRGMKTLDEINSGTFGDRIINAINSASGGSDRPIYLSIQIDGNEIVNVVSKHGPRDAGYRESIQRIAN